ncbi:PIN domain-containing protein [Nostoc sp. CHAB 5824]|nr:PIN domain-containing protein [Nostoc sp. CHAB 5824]
MTAILDTSFLFALTNKSDRNHSRVFNVANTLSEQLILLTSVLAEVCYLILSGLGHQVIRHFLVELAASDIRLESIYFEDLERVNEILEQYADIQLDFTQDLRTENLKPRSPLTPLKKGGTLKAPFLRGLGDLLCISPIYRCNDYCTCREREEQSHLDA